MISLREMEFHTVVVGTGAAGFHAAVRLHQYGERDLAVLTENVNAGTSRNTGSDKQTYYKLSLAGKEADSVVSMAEDLFSGQCVDGDLALCEAALSAKCFYHLAELGVPFPDNEYGESIGYRTDHDRGRRASSAGPYTSKRMVECLEREAASRHIPVLDHMQMIRLLVKGGRVYGVLCLDTLKTENLSFAIVWCENVVLATGGPAGMYHDSAYPVSQFGGSGIAFEAGVKGKNLTEWQYGMASVNPRWNVSGTYMQALPRFVSTDQQGNDEREFLMDYFENPARMQSLIFMKGYQWPFDSNKVFGGSSMIDLLVYQETVLKRRRVFLDFLHNPGDETIAFDALTAEAYEYLSCAGACFGTPIGRLTHMNEPAVLFYLEHGIDLRRERLEIAVCAQHNNGGLSTDCHWQTNIEGIYAVGEVCGSHGVTRPGGSALNAGQVGALRAAEHIVYGRKGDRKRNSDRKADREFCRRAAFLHMERISLSEGKSNIGEIWEKAALRMSRAGGMIRCGENLEQALSEVKDVLAHFESTVRITNVLQAGMYFRLYDMLLSQKVYLSAMLDYVRRGGKSRGSALYTCPDGEKPGEKMPDLYRCKLDGGELGGMIQEVMLCKRECRVSWREVRPIPEPDCCFETQWRAFRERKQGKSEDESWN